MKRKLTDRQEAEIRRQAFKEGLTAVELMKRWRISRALLSTICGGPIGKRGGGIEHSYAAR